MGLYENNSYEVINMDEIRDNKDIDKQKITANNVVNRDVFIMDFKSIIKSLR